MSTVEDLCENISLVDRAKIVLQGNVQAIRASFATKTYIVRSQHPILGNENYELLTQTSKNGMVESVIKKLTHNGNNALLSNIATQTEILGFEELLPSMNDVFIETVKKSDQ